MRPEELPAYLERIQRKVAEDGPKDAAYAMAREFHRAVTDETLVRYSHSRDTVTTSPPGQPPALVGGALRRAMHLFPAVRTGPYRATSHVIPMIVYARIQELGGVVTALHTYLDKLGHPHPGFLRWGKGKNAHFARSVRLPARPYMRPTHRRTIEDGSLRRAAAAAIKKLMH